MNASRYAELAARALRTTRVELPEAPPDDVRSAAIAALREALVQKQRARKRRIVAYCGLSGLAAAAAVAGIFVMRAAASTHPASPPPIAAMAAPASHEIAVIAHPSGSGASLISPGSPRGTLTDGRALDRGSRVISDAAGHALLALSTGTNLQLGEGSDLTVVDRGDEQRFRLDAGTVRATVSKLHAGQRFLVSTSDVEVEVRGTAFDVTVVGPGVCAGGARTRVTVSEGVVVVRHDGLEDRVAAGQAWPRDCAVVTGAHEAAASAVPEYPNAHAPAQSKSQAAAKASMLAEQNDLFAQGVAARRKGDAAGAALIFDRFLATYGASALAENAAAERMRALAAFDPPAARSAARLYATRYPGGFARAEADALVSASP
jgi:hypothetical protein